MIRQSFIAVLLFLVICSYCGKEFTTLGRHVWRCKQRIIQPDETNDDDEANTVNQEHVTQPPDNGLDVKCSCGKSCKGKRGLKMHQRSCRVIHGLNKELAADLQASLGELQDQVADDFSAQFTPNVEATNVSDSFPTL